MRKKTGSQAASRKIKRFSAFIPFICGSLVLLALLSGSAETVKAAGNVSFLDNQPVIVSLPAGQDQVVFVIMIYNAGDSALPVTLDAVELADSEGSPAPAGLLSPLPQQQTVEAHSARGFSLQLKRAPGSASEYDGRLVLISSDGSLDRLDVTLKLPATGAPTGLDPRFTPSLTRQTDFAWFSPLSAWLPGKIDPVVIPLAGDFAGPSRPAGQLSGPGLASVWQEKDRLVIADIPQAGEYSGTVDLRPLKPGTATLKLTIQARDLVYFPLLTLIAGLLLAYLLDNAFRVSLPKKRLELKLEEAIETVEPKQDKAMFDRRVKLVEIGDCLSVKRQAELSKQAFRIVDKDSSGNLGLLASAGERILDEFSKAQSDEQRAQWGPNGPEVEKALGYDASLAGINALSLQILNEFHDLTQDAEFLKILSASRPASATADEIPLVGGALDELTPCLFTQASVMQGKQDSLKSSLELMQAYRVTFARVANRIALQPKDDNQPYRDILVRMASNSMAGKPDLELEQKIFETLAIERSKTYQAPYGEEKEDETPGLHPRFFFGMATTAAEFNAYLVRALPFLQTARPLEEKTSQALRAELRRSEIAYWVVSSLVVLLSGLQALYVPNPTFGAWQDYLGVLLWGVVVSEGVRIGRSIAPQISRIKGG